MSRHIYWDAEQTRPMYLWYYLVGVANEPEPQHVGTVAGHDIYTDERMPPGRIDMIDHKGRVIGRIENVG